VTADGIPARPVSPAGSRPVAVGSRGGGRVDGGNERGLVAQAAVRSPWAWITVVVGVSFFLRAAVTLWRPGPWILPDELLYTDLARSIGDGHLPAVRGATSLGWGVIYPLVVSPAWIVFGNGLDAYRAALVVNALVMSLAAVPAFLLARLVVERRAALLVAAGAVLVPTMALTGSVMTENAAYPLFLTALWLMARAVRSPTLPAQGAALGSLALLVLTRVQGVALAPAFVAAVATYALLLDARSRRSYLLRFTPTATVLGIGLLAAAVISAAGWDEKVLAGRSGAAGDVVLAELPHQLGLQLGGLLVMVAVVPFVASGVMITVGLSRRAPERYRLYASIAWPTLAGTLGLVAIVGTAIHLDGAEGVNERYVFYLVPLLLVGLAAWFEARPERGRLALLILAAAVVVVALLPFHKLAADATFYAPSLAPWVALSLPGVLAPLFVGSALLLLGLLWLRLGARGTRAVAIWTASWLALVAIVAAGASQQHADTAMTLAGGGQTWIDDAVPAGESVTVVWDQRTTASAPDPDYFPLMVLAALNDSVGRFLRLGSETFYEKWLPTTHVTEEPDGTLVDATGERVRARFALVPCFLAVTGRTVSRSPDGRLTLVRTAGAPLRVRAGDCARGG
jgi:hypothetical protein